MQQQLACLGARMESENFAAQLPEVFEPRAQIVVKLCIDLAAQTLRNGRAFTAG